MQLTEPCSNFTADELHFTFIVGELGALIELERGHGGVATSEGSLVVTVGWPAFLRLGRSGGLS